MNLFLFFSHCSILVILGYQILNCVKPCSLAVNQRQHSDSFGCLQVSAVQGIAILDGYEMTLCNSETKEYSFLGEEPQQMHKKPFTEQAMKEPQSWIKNPCVLPNPLPDCPTMSVVLEVKNTFPASSSKLVNSWTNMFIFLHNSGRIL